MTTKVSAVMSEGIEQGTAVASTSGVSIDFTSIPSGVKRIKLMLSSCSGTGSKFTVRLGDSGGFETSGYLGSVIGVSVSTAASDAISSGFEIYEGTFGGASLVISGVLELFLVDASTNTWVASSNFAEDSAYVTGCCMAGTKSLSGELDRVRITHVDGSSTFDAGTINIQYEF